MKKYITILLLFSSWAMAQDMLVISQNRFVQFSPTVQYWSYDEAKDFTQVSFPVYAYLPLNNNTSINLRTGQANVSGSSITNLAGMTDTQLGVSYHYQDWNTVFTMGLNLPSGKRQLTLDEYMTSYLMSYNYFNLQIPNFGQGLNLAPGVNWAYELNEKIILGAAASFQLKGGFKPIDGMEDDYQPGNEITASAGMDYNFSETQILSTDVVYTTYGSDKYADNEIFASGDKIIVNLFYQQFMDFNHFSIHFRYRSKAKNDIAVAGEMVTESEKSIPDQFELIGRFRQRLTQEFHLGYLAQYRHFLGTSTLYSVNLAGLGIEPEYRISPRMLLTSRIRVNIGGYSNGKSMTGFMFTAGMRYNF